MRGWSALDGYQYLGHARGLHCDHFEAHASSHFYSPGCSHHWFDAPRSLAGSGLARHGTGWLVQLCPWHCAGDVWRGHCGCGTPPVLVTGRCAVWFFGGRPRAGNQPLRPEPGARAQRDGRLGCGLQDLAELAEQPFQQMGQRLLVHGAVWCFVGPCRHGLGTDLGSADYPVGTCAHQHPAGFCSPRHVGAERLVV